MLPFFREARNTNLKLETITVFGRTMPSRPHSRRQGPMPPLPPPCKKNPLHPFFTFYYLYGFNAGRK
jgi:hypothetical protein